MKVLFSTYSLAFQNPGGGEKVMLKTAESLRKMGHTVDLYNPWIHKLQDYDVVHYFSSLETGFWQAMKDQCPGIPLFVTPTQWNTKTTIKYKIKKWLEYFQPKWNRTIASRSQLPDFWFPTTSTESEFLKSNFGIDKNKKKVIPNAVEDDFFHSNETAFRTWSGVQGDFVLHIGRFHPVKNQLNLIRTFHKHKIPLVLIGGPDIDHVDYYNQCIEAANQTNSRIKILGPVSMSSEILPSAYASAKVLVLPSEFETFGLTIFEAMASKVPHIFATKNCAAKQEIDGFVEWIDPLDLESLAIKVKLTLNASNDRIQEKYTNVSILNWDQIAKKIETEYKKRISAN